MSFSNTMQTMHFAQTINWFKGKVTMVFITHQVPKGLQVDEVVNME
ncbi:hypothetical protein [Tepidiphilus margaritifer]|nr:hypothetical protein [Tepidiphilus margaritifer]